mmetsp:Transcript_504/g.704  ORF Transcript_504/g.704 Transcript_504/m.704 type:complete len:83 (-) Transcript_504:1250-1498(-)
MWHWCYHSLTHTPDRKAKKMQTKIKTAESNKVDKYNNLSPQRHLYYCIISILTATCTLPFALNIAFTFFSESLNPIDISCAN